ncbi:uncharacterized protein [Dermacentor andersoni]|uniref:uncharacterized protein isoform X1 n=1 Tax=Dermacentor andersoni TaxID=34620 RepID=UPI003B3A6670
MEHQRSQSGKPPVDGNKVIPLRCYGRGWKLIPLDELPIFQYLKRQATLQGVVVAGERGRPPQKHHHSSDELPDSEHNKDIGSSGGSHEMPLCAPALNVGLELMQPAQERSEVLCQPSTSQAAVRACPAWQSWRPRRHNRYQSPGPQSLHLADRHRYIPHMSGPPTSCHHQMDRPSHSIQPSPPSSKQCHLVPPVKGLPKGPSGSDCHGGARRKMPATSPDRGQGVSRSARKVQPPAKKAAFDPDTLSHPKDHSSWAEFLTKGVTRDPVDDSEGDLTICRDAEAQHWDTLMFQPDLEDEVTVCNEDEAKRHESDSPSAGGKPAAAVKNEPMETEESIEPKKDEVESEDYKMIRDLRLPRAPPE